MRLGGRGTPDAPRAEELELRLMGVADTPRLCSGGLLRGWVAGDGGGGG